MQEITIDRAMEIAMECHAAGRLREAESIYMQVLSQHPRHSEALHLMGVLAGQVGRGEEAVAFLEQSIQVNPHDAAAYSNLGNAFQALGRSSDAISAHRQALKIDPSSAGANNNLGLSLKAAGLFSDAICAYREAIRLSPGLVDAHNNLGTALKAVGAIEEAVAAYQRALQLRPDYAEVYSNLGNALMAARRRDDAVAAYLNALRLMPAYAEGHYNLANALEAVGRNEEAIAAYLAALNLKPDYADALNNLGIALEKHGKVTEAIEAYCRAIQLEPGHSMAFCNLGAVYRKVGQLDEAFAALAHAIALNPSNAPAQSNLGSCLKDQGRLDLAIPHYRNAVAFDPSSADSHSNLVYALQFDTRCGPSDLFDEACYWNLQHGSPFEECIPAHKNEADPERKLRVGYVSPDFRNHVVGHNILPLLCNHSHREFEVFCYSNVIFPDFVTNEIASHADAWRDISRVTDEHAAELIRKDRIDILVDTTMHMARNRLGLFARKPAPIQVSYLASCSTTGLKAIDFRISDCYIEPNQSDGRWYSEQVVRLPNSAWCYQPGGPMPEISQLPAPSAGIVTFGCRNNLSKVSPDVLDLWIEILRSEPRSQLLLQAPLGSCRESIRKQFASNGIGSGRLEFLGRDPWETFIRGYDRVDIALDPFPYNGWITTCDALYMGVPVVSLAQQTPLSRGGRSILTNLGLPELVASSPREYVQIALGLANDFKRLAGLRGMLRERIEKSPLRDSKGHTLEVEAAYRKMWKRWCVGDTPDLSGTSREF